MSRFSLAFIAIALTAVAPAIAQDSPSDPPAAGPTRYCYYAGLKYSTWAQLPNGQICQADGTWTFPQIASPDTSSEQPASSP
jgi:hypothetical protein